MDENNDLLSLFAQQMKKKDTAPKEQSINKKSNKINDTLNNSKQIYKNEKKQKNIIDQKTNKPNIDKSNNDLEDKNYEFIVETSENINKEDIVKTNDVDILKELDSSDKKDSIHSLNSELINIDNSNNNKLKEILQDNKENEKVLFPLLSPHVNGFKAFFIGNDGTDKEITIEKIINLLYEMGKVKSNEGIYLSFGNLPDEFEENKVYVIDDLSGAVRNLFNLEDFSDQASHQQFLYKQKLEKLLQAPKHSYIFLNATKISYSGFITLDARIRFLFNKNIYFSDLSNDAIYKRLMNNLPDFYKSQLPNNFYDNFMFYIERNRRFFPFNNEELVEYLLSYGTSQEIFELPPSQYKESSLDDSFKEIIGMENAKSEIRKLNQFLVLRRDLEKAGAKLPALSLHMMFLGPAGVGKTTIARVIGKCLFDLGYIREDKFIEVTSKDLVGAYGNQTGLKTNRVIQSALGGVLFVDEAYSLSNSCGMAGAEVIANLIKAMEDFRDDLVVMFAGYTLEMKEFIESNSGIASRISYQFKFDDYSVEELYDIYELMLKRTGMNIVPEATTKVKGIIDLYAGRRNFGNGRFVRNILQLTLTKHASLELSTDQIMTIIPESIPKPEEVANTSSVSN